MRAGTTIGMSSGEWQGGGLAVSQFRASLPEAEARDIRDKAAAPLSLYRRRRSS